MKHDAVQHLRKSGRRRRLRLVTAALCTIVLAGVAGVAYATYPADTVTQYAACLTVSGTSAGNIGSVAVGLNPAKPCGSNQMLIHLSGGTITQVSAGTGLNGGGNNGYVTVGIQPSYQLPQSGCSSGQFVASNGSGGWSCQSQKTYSGADFALSNQSCDAGQFLTGIDSSGLKQCANDQTYTNGTGLDLSTGAFSLDPGYQLPQSCSNGQVVTSNGDNTWSCKSAAGGLYSYWRSWTNDFGDDLSLSSSTGDAYAYCNAGDIVTGGGVETDSDVKASEPSGTNGWYARATTGAFSTGYVTVFVKCVG